ncbi:MAG: adenylate/guanylate cyclase domain-containing protein [Firmicutes bacterium]|nr:adenylate/guanylate cyclase domain-containing protein [Bacillota bacterium]
MQIPYDRFNRLLHEEKNETLRKGSFYAALMGIFSALLMFVFIIAANKTAFIIPALWALCCGLFTLVIHYFARRGNIKGFWQYPLIFMFVSLPSLIYIISYFCNKSGTAAYITGPPSYLYFIIIIITGFLFDGRISKAAGIIAGVEYFIIYLFARENLLLLQGPDPVLIQDLTDVPFYFFKSLMMAVAGVTVGILSENMKKLITRIIKEEHEKYTIDRLFGQYVSPEVKDKIVSEKIGLVGEKKCMVILMSDIRQFSTISETMEPDALVEQLNEYLEKMVACISLKGGVVDKFIGDAVLATFGGMMELENPGQSAVEAALLMQNELEVLNKKWSSEGKKPFRTGVGIHFGCVVQGSIGSSDRREFTIIGDPVNTVARMESLTKDYKTPVIISDEVFEMLSTEKKAEFSDLGETEIRGKSRSLHIYGLKQK